MKMEESEYMGYDGTQMFMRVWSPQQQPKAVLLGFHGLGSHSGLISHVGEFFANSGYLFYAPDMRGFGHYSGIKGHVDSFEEYNKDMESLVAFIKLKHPSLKLFLYGHSLGALWIVLYVMEYQEGIDGILLPSLAVSERLKIGTATRSIMKVLSKANVKKHFDTGLDLDLIARNPEVVKRNKEDPLRFDMVTPRMAAEGLAARARAFANAQLVTVPVFVLQPSEDLILIPEENKNYFDRIASKDKTWKQYDGLYHEPFQDEGGDELLKDMAAWLDERT
ncbi:MAG: alpha/beta hydrolase [Candidatus Thorarchaeota archaeon]